MASVFIATVQVLTPQSGPHLRIGDQSSSAPTLCIPSHTSSPVVANVNINSSDRWVTRCLSMVVRWRAARSGSAIKQIDAEEHQSRYPSYVFVLTTVFFCKKSSVHYQGTHARQNGIYFFNIGAIRRRSTIGKQIWYPIDPRNFGCDFSTFTYVRPFVRADSEGGGGQPDCGVENAIF